MVDWQVTATTIYCDAVGADVTIMVYKDWSTKCAICEDYGEEITQKKVRTLQKEGKKLGRKMKCEAPMCSKVIEYKDRLFAEERSKNS